MLIAPTGARVGPSYPLQRHSALQHPRVSLSGSRHGLIRRSEKKSSDILLRALAGSIGPVREPEEPHKAHEGARQLLGVSALAFFSFLAVVAKDRVTSPIVPPLLPTLTASASDAGSTKPEPVRATAENPDASTQVKNRRLLRAVWGMVTAPVKLVDSLLFPEEALLGSKAQQEPAPPSISTSAPAPKQPSAGRHAAAVATATADSISAAVPEAAPAAAAAGEALVSLSRQVHAFASAVPEAPAAVSPVTSTTPDFLVRLQEAVARLVSQQQQQASAQGEAAQDADSSTEAAAALAALRMLVGPDAMSLLPVLLVTAATAAAGLMLAATMAGVAGLVDKRQAMTPAQRAAQAALLDSPLRPIVCQTWPGFLPMLPSSIEPNYYRWRDSDSPTVAPGSSPASSSSSSSSVSGAAAAASAAACGPKEHPLDQEWWSFAQIQALRLMPELTSKPSAGSSGSDSTAASKAPTSSSSSSSAAAGTATAANTTKAAPAAAAAAAAAAAVPPTAARSFEDTKDSLYRAATAAARGDTNLFLAVISSSTDGSVLLGEAWELALQLATVDSLASPDTAWALTHGFGAGAPTQLLAEVCCLLPAAVVAVRAGAEAGSPDWQAGSISCWEQASLLVCMLLDPAASGVGRLQAVCEAMGVVGTAAAPDVLRGVLQEHCLHLVQQTAEAEAIPDLTYGHVPGMEAFLQRGKQRRVEFAAAALHSSIMAASVAAELWGEAVGEQATSAGSASPAAATEGVAWEQPRLLLRHAQLLHDVLPMPPRGESHGHLAAELLELSNPAMRQQGPKAQRLLDMQAGPPGGVGFKAPADAALHKEIRTLASAPLLLEAALRPVSANAWSREDDEVAETVVEALRRSLRAVKLPETAPLFQLRPQWPAAQQLAIMDSMLLPSTMANVLYLFTDCLCVLPGTLALLPAAVVNVRSFLDQQLAAVAQHSGRQASREDATGACLRIYRYLFVEVAGQRGDGDFFPEVLRILGLDLAAVAAAVSAVQAGQSVDAAAAAAAAAARGPVMELAGGWLLPDLPYSSDSRLDSAARPPLALSSAVCLSLLLHLGSTKRWLDAEDWELDEEDWDPAGSQQPSSDSHMPPAEACASLALLAAQWARSSVFKAPGSDAAAAVLLALLEQLQRAPNARASSRFSAQTRALLQAGQRSTGISKVVVLQDSWAAGMAAALVLPEGMDLGGDEQWLELQDYFEAKDNGLLPASMLGDGDADERQLLVDTEEQEEADANADATEADSERRRLGDGSSDEEEAEGWREEEEEEGSLSAEESSGAEWEAEAAQALQGVSADELKSGLVALEGYCERLLAAGLVTPAAAAERAQNWMQDSARFGVREAFDAAVFTAAVADCAGEEVAAENLRELSRTAPTWALVEVCRLLPQAVRQYRTAAADTDSAAGEVSSDGSWGLAARLMAAVLTPAAAPGATDAQGANGEGQAAAQGGSGNGQAPAQQKRKHKKKQHREDRQAMLVEAAQLQDEGPEPAASANGRVSEEWAPVNIRELFECKEAAAPDCELIPTVKKLLGLPADPADSAPSSGDVVPNRLALLLCQAMLMRGDDAQAKLQAAVGYLAAAHTPGSEALQLPSMLSSCMEALFSSEDWESPTGSARQLLSSLSGALPWQPYMSLQKQLMAKGLIRELEVPAEFE